MPPHICSLRTYSWMRCVGGFTRGRESASTSSTFRKICDRNRKRSIPTTSRMIGALRVVPDVRSATRAAGAKNLLQLVRCRDFELIVAAVPRRLIRTPALKDGGMAEAVALHVVVFDLAHPLDPQRLPRKIFPRAPAALPSRHAILPLRLCPIAPWMMLHRPIAERRQVD